MRLIVLLTLCGWSFAQEAGELFQKAPPDVDKALRAKVEEFFGLQRDGKFRLAERLVCEDSKDIYYTSKKEALRNFDIIKVVYEDQFQKAKVTLRVEGELRTPQGTMPSIVPMTTLWKVDGGAWCNYIPPASEGVQTPFGTMTPGPDNSTGGALRGIPPGGFTPEAMQQMKEQILGGVKVSRDVLKLNSEQASSDEVDIENLTAGEIQVFTARMLPRDGLKVTISQFTIPGGQKSKLRVEFTPAKTPAPPQAPYDFVLGFSPIPKFIPIHVTFEYPDAIKKKLPPELQHQK